MIRISAFAWVPPPVQGYVRDLRLRWALEEAGLDYTVAFVEHRDKDGPDYRAWQPFGQVPAFEEDGLQLFESGAIVLHLAERSHALLPLGATARARTIAWLFAALNTIEPAIEAQAQNEAFERDPAIREARRPRLHAAAARRLAPLVERLATREWLEDGFTCADLMLASVLRVAADSDLVSGSPPLAAYLARCLARPAFQKALADQLADFARHAPPAR